ncbi:DUF3304 domain-containing protein [Marinifilum sp. JC120]|nr:DUF3304 domain-containing protein [Marinifilum sp. JC120]
MMAPNSLVKGFSSSISRGSCSMQARAGVNGSGAGFCCVALPAGWDGGSSVTVGVCGAGEI